MNAIETLAADPADCAMMGEVLDTVREDSAMMVFPFQRGPILDMEHRLGCPHHPHGHQPT